MEIITLILNIVSAIFTKLVKTPAQKAMEAWNKWRKQSDENAKARNDNANHRRGD